MALVLLTLRLVHLIIISRMQAARHRTFAYSHMFK